MNNNMLYKIAKVGAALLGVIGVVLLVLVVMPGDEAVKNDLAVQKRTVDPFVTFTFVMMGITTVLALGFSLWGLIKNPAALKKAFFTLMTLGILLGIAYAWSNDAAVTDKYGTILEDGQAGPVSKRVGTLIYYTYILGAVGLATVVWGSLKSLFSK